ncbi:MAG: TRAP transporter large permease subunit [Deltaproteobacteria bacterium]|nr:TRAP transporter large permease subunit [Deltaproteobacteria bacterium]
MILAAGILIALFFFFGAPLFTIFGAAALLGFVSGGIHPSAVIIELYRMASASTLVAIPLFTFAGYMMAESKTPERMVNLTQSLIGWMPGGVALVCLFACAFFTAFTGCSGVTIIALGGLLYPILLKRNYPENFSLGLVTTCGSLGLLFPPSLPLILYGLIGQVDVDKLFLAGIVPGFLLIFLLGLYSFKVGLRSETGRSRPNLRGILKAIRDGIWIIPLPVIILVGIYGGYFTASEAAAVCSFYVFIVEILIYRDLKLKDVPRIIKDSMVLVGGILIILGVSLGFTSFLIDARVPMILLETVRQYITSPLMFLLILNILLLVVGCLMDIFSAIIVVVPLITPIAQSFGVNPIHLGIIFLTNLEIGYLTPPVGLNLFISSYRFKKPVLQVARFSLPFMLILIAALMLITYVPSLSLGLLDYLKMH